MTTENVVFTTLYESKWVLGNTLRLTLSQWTSGIHIGNITIGIDWQFSNGLSGFEQFNYTGAPIARTLPSDVTLTVQTASMSSITVVVNGLTPITDRFYKCINGACTEVLAGSGGYVNDPTCAGACSATGTPGLYVDGKQGSVKVALAKPVALKVQGIGAGKSVRIDNISATPDEIVAQGTTDSNGIFETTVIFSVNTAFQLRAYYNCVAFVCANETNTVNVQAGEGETDWMMYAVIIGILVIVFFYSKELGVFQAIRKR